MTKQIVLFGAGDYGVKALRHFGAGRVKCFADNNAQKIGQILLGKPIVGFSELIAMADMFSVVISSSYFLQMSEQLENAGVSEYQYFSPAYSRAIKNVASGLLGHSAGKITIFGVDEYTDRFLVNLKKTFEADNRFSICHVSDMDKSRYLGENCSGFEVGALHGSASASEYFIVGSEVYHAAYYLRLQQLFGDTRTIIDPFMHRAYYETDETVVNPYASGIAAVEEDSDKYAPREVEIERVGLYVRTALEDVPLFKFVEIETVNRCNGICDFCPVNKNSDPREKKIMPRELFNKIIGELEAIGYRGELALFSNNEPLLDDRIIELSGYAREKLPDSRIHMFSNGTLFTIEKFKALMPYLDELVIDNYRQDLKLIRPCREIADYVEQHDYLREKVTIVLRKPREVLTSRGGDAPNKKESATYEGAACALPFQQLVIRPDGKVSLCCNDALGRHTLGDLSREKILDVWYGNEYTKLRGAIAKGREHWGQCKYCDTFYVY